MKNPPQVIIDGAEYTVDRLSFEAFGAHGFPAPEAPHSYTPGDVLPVQFILPLSSHEVFFQADAELGAREGERAQFQFVDLTPEAWLHIESFFRSRGVEIPEHLRPPRPMHRPQQRYEALPPGDRDPRQHEPPEPRRPGRVEEPYHEEEHAYGALPPAGYAPAYAPPHAGQAPAFAPSEHEEGVHAQSALAPMRQQQMSAPVQVSATEQQDREEQEHRFRRRLALYGISAVVLMVLGGLLLLQRASVFSTQASVRGDVLQVGAPVSGLIQNMYIDEGEEVSPSQLLFEIDDSEYQAEIEARRADLEQRRANVQALRERLGREQGRVGFAVRTARGRVDVARERLEEARAELRQVEAELVRARRLFDGGALTRSQLEDKETAVDAAQARVDTRVTELRLAQTAYEEARTGGTYAAGVSSDADQLQLALDQQEAAARNAELQLQQAANALDRTRVEAHEPGRVFAIRYREGSYVKAGDPVLVLETVDNPYVVAYFPVDDAKLLYHGLDAQVRFPARGLVLPGEVQAIGQGLGIDGSALNGGSGFVEHVPVKVALADIPAELETGMQAEVEARLGAYAVLSGLLW